MTKRSYIERIWDIHYWIYDFTWAVFQRSSYQAISKTTADWSSLNVLEVGCGKASYLNSYNKSNDFYLIDASPKMVEAAKKNVKNNRMEHVKLVECQSIYKTTFENQFFDVVVCSHVLTVVDDAQMALHEIRRLLKPQGRLIIANHVPKNSFTKNNVVGKVTRFLGWQSSRDTTKLAQQNGFSKIASVQEHFSEVVIFKKD